MSPNILVLTSIYPASDISAKQTAVVHYFCREWVRVGYHVRVIYYATNFPALYYFVAKPFSRTIESYVGYDIRTALCDNREYEMDGVLVKRIGIKKRIPHSLFPRKQISLATTQTIDYCKETGFIPDIIIGHWPNPQLEIMQALKSVFNCRTCYVSHGDSVLQLYKQKSYDLLNAVDIIGFRNELVKQRFQKESPLNKPSFLCYSGVPEAFLENRSKIDFSNIQDFIFVGSLIQRKYPSKIIDALTKAYENEKFTLRYIGEGAERTSIEKKSMNLGVNGAIELLGNVERKEVIAHLDKSQVFVMISKREAFGLVYLEAMARGLITIASRNESFDGIIKDGENGFLCEAGNVEELSRIISRIRAMSDEELQTISRNAIATAELYTDSKVAKTYIEAIQY